MFKPVYLTKVFVLLNNHSKEIEMKLKIFYVCPPTPPVGQMVKSLSAMQSGRSPGEGNGYPLQYSCLENSMD